MADAGRVIAGTARGVRLTAPGPGTRPLGDRVKQALFAVLGPNLDGAAVLDLFAGSGAAGIEALSRGAARAVFVEHETRAVRVIGENLRRTGLAGGRAIVVRRDAIGWLAEPGGAAARGPFDVVILDPPYVDAEALRRALELVGPHVVPGGRVVAKHFWRDAPPDRAGLLASERERRFGETALTFYRRAEARDGGDSRGGDRPVNVAVYPGSFDPITNGHLDIVRRAAHVFDRVVVAVLGNPRKTPLLPAETRVDVVRRAIAADPELAERVEVRAFDGLTVAFCRSVGARFLVRGLRAIADFETELQLAHNNHQLAPEVDTVFFMTSLEHSYISSSLAKEIALFGGDVSTMVPGPALDALAATLAARPRPDLDPVP